MTPLKRLRAITTRLTRGLGWRRNASLPDAVYRELVASLFTMSLPILGMGIIVTCVAALIFIQRRDAAIAILAIGVIGVTAVRLAIIARFHKAGGSAVPRDELTRWERHYALGNYAFALLLGAFAVFALITPSTGAHMLTVSLVFTFGAGMVSRTAGRPVICMTSLLMVTIPTVAALAFNAAQSSEGDLNFQIFAAEGLIVAIVTALSIQSTRHVYRATVEQLIIAHELSHLARMDDLTGLPNRLLLSERFRIGLAAMTGQDQHLALHFLDLDGFKAINDRYGHPAGDALLCQVAGRLCSIVRASDTVARLGGDEFVVVQTGVYHASEAEMLARRIVKQLSSPYDVGGTAMEVSVSIGIAMAPQDADNWEDLSARADAALYSSKSSGKGQFAFCADLAAIPLENTLAIPADRIPG